MNSIAINKDLSHTQVFLLKNLSFLPDLPISAKDLFKFLGINEASAVDFFDALHDLSENWLEYSDAFYILPKSKALRIQREYKPGIKDTFRLLNFFIEMYSTPNSHTTKELEQYEPYIISLLQNVKENSATLAALHGAYGHYLSFKQEYQQAQLLFSKAINILREIQPESPYIAKFLNELAQIFLQLNNYDKTEQILEQAISQQGKQTRQTPEILFETYFLFAEVYLTKSKYKLALTYYLKSLEIINLTNDKLRFKKMLIHLQVSEVYRQLKDYTHSLQHLNKSEQILQRLPSNIRNIYLPQIEYKKNLINNLNKLNYIVDKAFNMTFIGGVILAVIGISLIAYYFIFIR